MGFNTELYVEKKADRSNEPLLLSEATNCIPLFWILGMNQGEKTYDELDETITVRLDVRKVKENIAKHDLEIKQYFEREDNADYCISIFNRLLADLNDDDLLTLEFFEWQMMGYQSVESCNAMFDDIKHILENNLIEEIQNPLYNQYPNDRFVDQALSKLAVTGEDEKLVEVLEMIVGVLEDKYY